MEIKFKILDIFPSIKELSKDNDLIININELEYNLKEILNKDLLINVSSYLYILIKKEFTNQIIGEGKIELTKIARINLNKPIINWINLTKDKKKKNVNNIQKSDLINNIFDFLKIKIQIIIVNNKTSFIPIEYFNKIPINKEITKPKSPIITKVTSIFQNNSLLKNYNTQSPLYKNKQKKTKSISFIKNNNNKSFQNINKQQDNYPNNNEIKKLNHHKTSKSFITENIDFDKIPNKNFQNQTQKKISSSKIIKNLGENLLKNDDKNIEKFQLDTNEIKEIQNFNHNNYFYDMNKKSQYFKNNIKDESKEKTIQETKENIKNDNLNIKIEKENIEKKYDIEDDKIEIYSEKNENIENENIENPIDEDFLTLKNDFEIFYTKEYLDEINDDLINLEIELCLEKIFELILCYHKTLKQHEKENDDEEKKIKNYISENKALKKQIIKIKRLNEINENQKDYIQIKKKLKEKIIQIFKQDKEYEIKILKSIFSNEKIRNNEKLKSIFSQIILNSRNKIKDPKTKKILKKLFPNYLNSKKKNSQIETIPKVSSKTLFSKGIKNSYESNKVKRNKSNNSLSINSITFTNNIKTKIPQRKLNYSGTITISNSNDFKFT